MSAIKLVWEFEPTIEEDDAILEAKAILQDAGMSVELVGGRAKGRG